MRRHLLTGFLLVLTGATGVGVGQSGLGGRHVLWLGVLVLGLGMAYLALHPRR